MRKRFGEVTLNHARMQHAFLAVAGIALVVLALNDVFQSVIVPRAVGRTFRPSYYATSLNWRLWPKLSWRIYPRDHDRREDFLALFAPLQLVVLLMMWSFLLIGGYALILYAIRADIRPHLHSPLDAFYFAGTSFFTIGFGDYVGGSTFSRLVSLAAGASGFGVISTTTAYLFAIFGSFQTREQFVVWLGARAGIPPSGVGLLTLCAQRGNRAGLDTIMLEGQRWSASILESHLAYPMLTYFRSSHDNESWVGTLGTLLDAAVLLSTSIDGLNGEAAVMVHMGCHTANDLASYFHVNDGARAPGISREEFETALNTLESAGYMLRDRDQAWLQFAQLRAKYASDLNGLAAWFEIPPLQWVGDRSLIAMTQHSQAR